MDLASDQFQVSRASLKKVLGGVAPPPAGLSLGVRASGWGPWSRQWSSQWALPAWTDGEGLPSHTQALKVPPGPGRGKGVGMRVSR